MKSTPKAPVTLQDEAPPPPQMSPAEIRATRLLVFVTSLSAIILALIMILAAAFFREFFDPGHRSTDPSGTSECTEEFDDCGVGRSCVLGECREVQKPGRCQQGDPCDRACTADGTLHCDEVTNRYIVTVTSPVCNDDKVLDFIASVEAKCASAKSCESSKFEELAISMDDFWELLSVFPTTHAIHFPYGKPSKKQKQKKKKKKKNTWPSEAVKAHYKENIKLMLPALHSAEFVLLVATASRDRSSNNSSSNDITYDRVTLTRELIDEVIDDDVVDRVQREELKDKLKVVKIGASKQIEADAFSNFFGSRSVAWNLRAEEQLRGLLELGEKLKNPKQILFRDRTINQTVFIVPIPCNSRPKKPR